MDESQLEKLKCLEKDLQEATERSKKCVKYEDAAIFIGLTRSGKSSLLNYLIGTKLQGYVVFKGRPVSIIKEDSKSSGPAIGIGSSSKTVYPTRWTSQKYPGLALWDAPGFDDNRGEVQDITNAFYICELFKNIKSAKIVLVSDINDIAGDNIKPFLSLFNSVEQILNEKMRACFPGIAIIFSKVPDKLNDVPVDKDFINDHFDHQCLRGGEDEGEKIQISESVKDLIKHLKKNNKQIGFFRKATFGEVTDAIDGGIFNALKDTASIDEKILKQVSPSIAPTSELFLFQGRQQLYCRQSFNELQNLIERVFTQTWHDFEIKTIRNVSQNELLQLSQELSSTKNKLVNAVYSKQSFEEKLKVIGMVDNSVEKHINDHNMLQRANLLQFSDRLLRLKESDEHDFSLQGVMVTALTIIERILVNIQLKLSEISKEEAEARIVKIEQKFEGDKEHLRSQLGGVNTFNAQMMQALQEKIQMMHEEQARRDSMSQQAIVDLKDKMKRIRKKEKYEREKAEEREMERRKEWMEEMRRERVEAERKERAEAKKKERAEVKRRERDEAERKGTHDLEIKINFEKILDIFKIWKH